jgi:hypothetical protein
MEKSYTFSVEMYIVFSHVETHLNYFLHVSSPKQIDEFFESSKHLFLDETKNLPQSGGDLGKH